MPQPKDDLSKSLVALDQHKTLIATIELSLKSGSSAESVGDSAGYSGPNAWRWWGCAGVGSAGSGAADVTTKCDSARRIAVKPCACGAPLCGCGA